MTQPLQLRWYSSVINFAKPKDEVYCLGYVWINKQSKQKNTPGKKSNKTLWKIKTKRISLKPNQLQDERFLSFGVVLPGVFHCPNFPDDIYFDFAGIFQFRLNFGGDIPG